MANTLKTDIQAFVWYWLVFTAASMLGASALLAATRQGIGYRRWRWLLLVFVASGAILAMAILAIGRTP